MLEIINARTLSVEVRSCERIFESQIPHNYSVAANTNCASNLIVTFCLITIRD